MNKHGRCICCGSSGTRKRRATLPKSIFSVRAEIFCCPQCGLGATVPEPDTSLGYYEDNTQYTQQFQDNYDLYLGFARQLLSCLDTDMTGKHSRLLDVACGGGGLVEAAQAAGFIAEGVESNRQMVSWCRNRGLDVQYGDVATLINNGEKKYDVIVLSAILEHVQHPAALIRECLKILAPDGCILVSQAAHDGLLPRIFPWVWYGWQPKEHFWHFTPPSLTALAKACGCRVTKLSRNSLHHPWFFQSSPTQLIGRNLAALMARLGTTLNRGDQFCMVLKHAA